MKVIVKTAGGAAHFGTEGLGGGEEETNMANKVDSLASWRSASSSSGARLRLRLWRKDHQRVLWDVVAYVNLLFP